jgi:histidinol dehydrogenase
MKIYDWNELTRKEQSRLLKRQLSLPLETHELRQQVAEIIHEVKAGGDEAIIKLTAKYDKADLTHFVVSDNEILEAGEKVDPDMMQAIKYAMTQIETYHLCQYPQAQHVNTVTGVFCERQPRPIESIGLYIPGGTAPLISTMMMLAIPAKIARCPSRVLCTPPDQNGKINPYLLQTAKLCDIKTLYKIGGAQAIAAMAYGTKTIAKVDKIFGPGNAWVTQAKILVAEDPHGASIDMPAGPSELMVIADDAANPAYVAIDLLSQAEHGVDSKVILITPSKKLAFAVLALLEEQLKQLPRQQIAKKSLAQSFILVVDDINQGVLICNAYAPEHLSLQVINPVDYVQDIRTVGAVFLGPWTPETLGDYVTGANHVLPTFGFAKTLSGLSVVDFMKFISIQRATQDGLKKIGPIAEKLASIEGLDAHKEAVSLRLKAMLRG